MPIQWISLYNPFHTLTNPVFWKFSQLKCLLVTRQVVEVRGGVKGGVVHIRLDPLTSFSHLLR